MGDKHVLQFRYKPGPYKRGRGKKEEIEEEIEEDVKEGERKEERKKGRKKGLMKRRKNGSK